MKFKSLADEDKIQFLLSWWGNGISLGFKANLPLGEDEQKAIERCFNWADNTGTIKGPLHWLYEKGSSIAYVLSTFDDLRKGLVTQFRGEIILNHEVAPIKEFIDEETGELILDYDESLIQKMAEERAEKFMKEKIVNENFMANTVTSIAPVYGWGNYGDKNSIEPDSDSD